MSSRWAQIDWETPAFLPWAPLGQSVARRVLDGADLCLALNQQAEAAGLIAPHFVAPDAVPKGMAYEAFINESLAVPTRSNLHDFFNALCWLRYPLAKRAMNRMHVQESRQMPALGGGRGAVRDAMTVFDESGAMLQAPEALWQALVARQWERAFVALRPLWREATFDVFGHAVLEKLTAPFKAITAHVVYLGEAGVVGIHQWDAALTDRMNAAWWVSKPMTPVPVLGLPGWCPENEGAAYYRDENVFRPVNWRRKA